jgi:hypothetical protein
LDTYTVMSLNDVHGDVDELGSATYQHVPPRLDCCGHRDRVNIGLID